MNQLVFVTQLLDPNDPVLGVTSQLVATLAGRCERLVVIANEVRRTPSLDAQVISLGKEDGASRARRTVRFLRAIGRTTREARVDALLAHMCPAYLNLAAPIAKPRRVRLMLWYAHPGLSAQLRLATRLTDVVLTSLPGTFPLATPKLQRIGQAIDVGTFSFAPLPDRSDGLRLLALGRTSPVKGYPTIIRAVAAARRAGLNVQLRIEGASGTPGERAHRAELIRMIDELGIGNAVILDPGVPREAVPELLRSSHAVVNATRSGSGDKAVFEAMAVGRPVLLSNRSFAPLVEDLPLDVRFQPGDHGGLADRILALAEAPPASLDALGRELHTRIASGHSLDHWADEVVRASRPPSR